LAVRRLLFYLLAGLSLLLCIAVGALFIRSYLVSDGAVIQTKSADTSVISNRGILRIRHDELSNGFGGQSSIKGTGWLVEHSAPFVLPAPPTSGPLAPVSRRFLGFSWESRQAGQLKQSANSTLYWWPYWELKLPHIAVVILLTILPTIAIAHIRNQKRRAKGLCQFCGYDLRASPARCPECGRLPAKASNHSG
jgi:hypothetical protein